MKMNKLFLMIVLALSIFPVLAYADGVSINTGNVDINGNNGALTPDGNQLGVIFPRNSNTGPVVQGNAPSITTQNGPTSQLFSSNLPSSNIGISELSATSQAAVARNNPTILTAVQEEAEQVSAINREAVARSHAYSSSVSASLSSEVTVINIANLDEAGQMITDTDGEIVLQ